MAGFLHSAGIKAIVSADDEGGLNPALLGRRRARVLVNHSDAERARTLLDEQE